MTSLLTNTVGRVIALGEGGYFIDFYDEFNDGDGFSGALSYVTIYDDPASVEPSLESYDFPESFEFEQNPGDLEYIYIEDAAGERSIEIYPVLYGPEPDGEGRDFEFLDMGFQGGVPPSQGGTLEIRFFGEALIAPSNDDNEYQDVEIQLEITFGERIE